MTFSCGVARFEPRAESVHFLPRFVERDAGREPGEDAQKPRVAGSLLGGERQGRPHLRIGRPEGRKAKALRHHTRDDIGVIIEDDGFPDERRVLTKAAAPEMVAQHNDSVLALVPLVEHASQERLRPEKLEERGRCLQTMELIRRSPPVKVGDHGCAAVTSERVSLSARSA